MTHNDDLDRALAALPLEEPPEGFRARVLAATVYAPRVPEPTRSLEPWLLGTLGALLVWLCGLVVAEPRAFGGAVASAVASLTLVPPSTWVWIAGGCAAAFWLSALSVPAPRRIARR